MLANAKLLHDPNPTSNNIPETKVAEIQSTEKHALYIPKTYTDDELEELHSVLVNELFFTLGGESGE